MALILVADDDTDLLEVVLVELAEAGFKTLSAIDGRQALALFTEQPSSVDCVITDFRMPQMDGFALAGELKKIRDIPIVIMSGKDDLDLQSLYSSGVSGILPKPIDFGTLTELLDGNLTIATPTTDHTGPSRSSLRHHLLDEDELSCEVKGTETTHFTRIRNISTGGMDLVFDASEKIGKVNLVHFTISLGSQSIIGQASLKWKFLDEIAMRAGFQFTDATKAKLNSNPLLHKLTRIDGEPKESA